MTNSNLTGFANTEKHLSAGQMYEYLDNQLPANARYEIEQHLQDCTFCSEAMEGLMLAPTENTKQVVFELNHHLKKRTRLRPRKSPLQDIKNWALAAAIIMLLVIAALVVYFQVKHYTGPSKDQNKKEQLINTGIGSKPNRLNLEL